MGVKRVDDNYLKNNNIDPHSFKDDYGVSSDYDIGIDTNSREIILINNNTGNCVNTGENFDDYKKGDKYER